MTAVTHKDMFALIERFGSEAVITIKKIESREVLVRYETLSKGAAKSALSTMKEISK